MVSKGGKEGSFKSDLRNGCARRDKYGKNLGKGRLVSQFVLVFAELMNLFSLVLLKPVKNTLLLHFALAFLVSEKPVCALKYLAGVPLLTILNN